MPRPAWISGRELATIWMSRIAMNIPTAMATNPAHVLTPTPPAADVRIAAIWAPSQPPPRREDPLLDPDPTGNQREVQGRKNRRDRNRPEGERQRRDFGDHQHVIRVPEIAERAGARERSTGQGDDPRRPIPAQAR